MNFIFITLSTSFLSLCQFTFSACKLSLFLHTTSLFDFHSIILSLLSSVDNRSFETFTLKEPSLFERVEMKIEAEEVTMKISNEMNEVVSTSKTKQGQNREPERDKRRDERRDI